MRYIFRNISLIAKSVIFVLIVLPCNVLANTDTIPRHFIRNFNSNLIALNKLYCRNDTVYVNGKFSFNEKVDFSTEHQKSETLFALDVGAAKYFDYFTSLPISDKENLIRYFSVYQNYFGNELIEAGLPEEIKSLAPVLSAMNPLAVGENYKAGIWQLNHFQAVLSGLEINKLVDERFNERKATQAFIKQLKKYETDFGTIELGMIAYLAGNAKLRNVLGRLGDYHSITKVLQLLPHEVQNSIAAFQAMSVFLSNNRFIHFKEIPLPALVKVNRQVHFNQISTVLNISEEHLQFLNPQFKHSIIPGNETVYQFAIPAGKRDDFVLWSDSIYNAYDSTLFQVVQQNIEYPPAPNRQYLGEKVKDLEIEGKTKIKYTIKSGDVLGFIAEDYDVRVADLKYWNNIYNERRIQVGQKLDIFVDNDKVEYYQSLQNGGDKQKEGKDIVQKLSETSPVQKYTVPDNARKVEHTVKSGESPYVIAKKYDGVTPEQILEWNGIKDARKIQIGQKLIIYLE